MEAIGWLVVGGLSIFTLYLGLRLGNRRNRYDKIKGCWWSIIYYSFNLFLAYPFLLGIVFGSQGVLAPIFTFYLGYSLWHIVGRFTVRFNDYRDYKKEIRREKIQRHMNKRTEEHDELLEMVEFETKLSRNFLDKLEKLGVSVNKMKQIEGEVVVDNKELARIEKLIEKL